MSAKLQLHLLLAKLEEKGYQLIPSEELIEHNLSRAREAWRSDGGIGSVGFDPQILSRLSGIGARPVKRLTQKEIINEISRQIIAGTLEPGVNEVIDLFDGKIVVHKPITEKKKNGNGKRSPPSLDALADEEC
ncbi:MAG: hypothetical protein JNJ91_13050 [Flavobacteriales bacterium]|nr:hypothetical protein [Flavobacteriales bacterium]